MVYHIIIVNGIINMVNIQYTIQRRIFDRGWTEPIESLRLSSEDL
jgi:hypothetical protein